jgi:cytochrome P450
LYQRHQYFRDLEDAAPVLALRSLFPFVNRLIRWGVPLPGLKRANLMIQRAKSSAEDRLQRHGMLTADEGTNHKPTLFTKLHAAGEENLSKEELLSNAQLYIIAGSDTTGNALTWLIWLVCKHPEVKEKLLAELRTVPEPLNYMDLKDLSYLGSVIDESLRLYPPIPSTLLRSVPAKGVELAGYWFEGGTTVSTQAYTLHRDASVFPNPDTFDPSRWDKSTKAMKDAYMAFGAGSRSK